MKITMIHGQAHKGITHFMAQEVLHCLLSEQDEFREFFLPKDGPNFCVGCNACFLKGESHCPSAQQVQPIAEAIEWADVILLSTPNYVMEMSGPMKNLMDHLAYRWITHRPHGAMFTKTGIALCSSAGAPAGHVTRSLAKQLKWMGVPKVYCFPLISQAMTVRDMKPEKKAEVTRKAAHIARKVKKRMNHRPTSLRNRLMFSIFRKMQTSPAAGWNPTDRDWWVNQGWTKKIRP